MAWWIFFAFLLFISSRSNAEFSEEINSFLEQSESIIAEKAQLPPCMQKILPCQPYIKSPENPPPACCSPLKEMLDSDFQCLCSFFGNAELLKTLNVTQSIALQLPKACGANLDMSACNHAGPISPTSSTAAAPLPHPLPSTPAANTSGDSSPSKPSSSTRNNPAYGIGYGVAAASSFVALLLPAF